MRSLKKTWTWTRPGFEIWDGQQSEVEGLFLAGSGCDVTNLEMCEINKWCTTGGKVHSCLFGVAKCTITFSRRTVWSVAVFFIPPHTGATKIDNIINIDSPMQFWTAPVPCRWCKSILVCLQHHRNPTDGKKTGHRQISTLSGLSDIQVIFLWHVWPISTKNTTTKLAPQKNLSSPSFF